MQRPLNRALLSLALLAACVASAQAAAVSLQADLNNLTLTATDLNPSDGQAPSVAWVSQPKNSVSSSTAILQNGWDVIKDDDRYVHNVLPILSSQVALGNVGATSSIDLHGAHLNAHANDGLGAYANGWSRETGQPSTLLVSPFTRITLNAQASVAFFSDPSCKTVMVNGFERSCSDGHVGLSVDLTKGTPQPGGSNSFQLSMDFDSRTGSDQLGAPILLTIENNSAEATYFGLAFGGAVWVHDYTPAGSVVPEPGELGMLLAGLGTLLLARRRRKSASLKKGLAVAAVATLSAPAWSAMTLDTQITQLQFTATDLTPADGQAASFEWLSPSMGNTNQVAAEIYRSNVWPHWARDTHQGSSLFAPVSAAVQVGDAKATASITADGLHLRSESDGIANTDASANLGPTWGYDNNLWVAPHTRVTVTGQATFQFTNNHLCQAANPGPLTCGYAFSDYRLGFTRGASLDLATSYGFSAGAYTVGAQDVTVPIVLSFENNRSEGTLLKFYGYARNATMVPEPDALALMFAGVLVSCIARRAAKRR